MRTKLKNLGEEETKSQQGETDFVLRLFAEVYSSLSKATLDAAYSYALALLRTGPRTLHFLFQAR